MANFYSWIAMFLPMTRLWRNVVLPWLGKERDFDPRGLLLVLVRLLVPFLFTDDNGQRTGAAKSIYSFKW